MNANIFAVSFKLVLLNVAIDRRSRSSKIIKTLFSGPLKICHLQNVYVLLCCVMTLCIKSSVPWAVVVHSFGY